MQLRDTHKTPHYSLPESPPAWPRGETLGHYRRRHALGCWRQPESLEHLYVPARQLRTSTTLGASTSARAAITHSFVAPQCGKGVIGIADDASKQRRFKLDHHMPRHRHDVGAALAGGRQWDHRTRFEQLVDFGQG